MFKKPETGNKPLIVTIAGEPGIGKTTMAATFPKPGFIKLEDGTKSISKNEFVETDVLATIDDAAKAVQTAMNTTAIKTIVIDSISTLETFVEDEIVASDKRAKSIMNALGGYGAGLKAVGSKMGKFRKLCDQAAGKGKNIVFICHTTINEIKPVDTEPYNVLNLRLNKYTIPHFVDLVDCVGFLKLVVNTADINNGQIGVSTGERELVCHASASIGAKNRLGISSPLMCEDDGTNPIIKFLKGE